MFSYNLRSCNNPFLADSQLFEIRTPKFVKFPLLDLRQYYTHIIGVKITILGWIIAQYVLIQKAYRKHVILIALGYK